MVPMKLGKKRTVIFYGSAHLLISQFTILFPALWMGGFTMDRPSDFISSFDCDVLRSAFIKLVIADRIPDDLWRSVGAQLISDFTGSDDVDPDLLEWIVRK